MKTILITLIICIASISSYSQKIGIKAGVLISKSPNQTTMFGGTAGLFLQTKGNIYFIAEGNFKSINGSIMVPKTNSQNVQTGEVKKVYNSYLVEMPLMIGVMGNLKNEKGTFRPFANIGASPAIIIGSRYDKKSYTSKDDFNLSLVVSPGVMAGEKVSIEARFNKSLIGLEYTSFSFIIGYRF